MTNARDLVLFFIISFCIMFGWNYFVEQPKQELLKQQQLLEQMEQGNSDVKLDSTAQSTELSPAKQEIIPLKTKEQVFSDTKNQRIPIETKSFKGSISLKGATIDDLVLKNYKLHNEENSPPVTLLSPSGTEDVYFSRFGWVTTDENLRVPDNQSMWKTNESALTVDQPITLWWDNRQGQIFYITIRIDNQYLFNIEQKIVNSTTNAINFHTYGIVSRAWQQEQTEYYILHEGVIGVPDGTLKEISYSDLKEDGKAQFSKANGWLGLTDKYWLAAIIPDQSHHFKTSFSYNQKNGADRYQADFLSKPLLIEGNQEATSTHLLYAGAKRVHVLDEYANQYAIPLFDRAIDFGVLYVITKPIFYLLQFFNGLLGNFGLALMALTVIVKLIMFPLANKSYKSFAKMKKLAPQTKAIKERYANDRQRMSQEMMLLYKEQKVNPMAGCLPMLLQIPVFFALYKVLFVTIEMRHAPFYGWIKDLSVPDPTTIFNLFGLLSWQPPSLLMVGALPILMSVSMVIQQKLSPPPSDEIQAKVMKMLPWIFMFIFAGFPAGLVLYWVWNNILSILQQWWITRSVEKEST